MTLHFVLLLALAAQEQIEGRALFAKYCSIPYCHGPDGGQGRAPELRGRSWNRELLRAIVTDGIEDTSMPPFGARLTEAETDVLVDFILSVSVAEESAAPVAARDDKVGDPAAGRALFFEPARGRCAGCHRFGRDDFPGPDLHAAGGTPFEILRNIVEPEASISEAKPLVRVETKDESFSAIRQDETESAVVVHDLSSEPPTKRRLSKEEVASIEPLPGSAMPGGFLTEYSAKELRDLVFLIASDSVATRPVDIWSDGTRMSGDLFYPTGLEEGEKLPAIVMSHGWGGLRSHLNEAYAPYFAGEGFIVLAFDYRGWGESDSPLVLQGEEVRDIVDPLDQIEDIVSALHFIEGEDYVDAERIGYWGSSYSGGHAAWIAAHDPHVKAVVAQVPAMDSVELAVAAAGSLEGLHRDEIQRARGELPPAPIDTPPWGELRGHPYLSRMARYSPRDVADRIRIPILIMDAENEELFDIREHGQKVYEIVKDNAPAEYHVFPGITHYGVYRERRVEALGMAIEWFRRHLGLE